MQRVIKHLKIFLIGFLAAVILIIAVWEINERANEKVVLTEYTFLDKNIPESFDGYKIFVVSDLHNAPFADDIIRHIEKTTPDIIVFLGDMVQLPDINVDEAKKIAKEFKNIIPVYSVSGNHESQNYAFPYIYDELAWEGAVWLENDRAEIKRGEDSIILMGIKDPHDDYISPDLFSQISWYAHNALSAEQRFTVLLNHRSDLYPALKDCGADLILSGHMHGGIVRLPFIGGIKGHGEGFSLPKYDYGLIKEGGSASMIVSGGCDKNPDKKRWFNPPEVLLITLESE